MKVESIGVTLMDGPLPALLMTGLDPKSFSALVIHQFFLIKSSLINHLYLYCYRYRIPGRDRNRLAV